MINDFSGLEMRVVIRWLDREYVVTDTISQVELLTCPNLQDRCRMSLESMTTKALESIAPEPAARAIPDREKTRMLRGQSWDDDTNQRMDRLRKALSIASDIEGDN